MKDLKGRTILITGASRGIGREVARHCARAGARVLLAARTERLLQSVCRELAPSHERHRAYVVDVGDSSAIDALMLKIRHEPDVSWLDGLVNCAAICGPIGTLEETDPGELMRTLQVNLLGTIHLCRSALPLLRQAARGKIVNFSGGGAVKPFARYTSYAVSKAAVVRFTENLAVELLGQRMDINAVAPGFVATDFHQATLNAGTRAGGAYLQYTRDELARGGVPPQRAAALTVFLLSSASDGISGKLISAPWDPWQDESFRLALRSSSDLATLRRIDRKFFSEKGTA